MPPFPVSPVLRPVEPLLPSKSITIRETVVVSEPLRAETTPPREASFSAATLELLPASVASLASQQSQTTTTTKEETGAQQATVQVALQKAGTVASTASQEKALETAEEETKEVQTAADTGFFTGVPVRMTPAEQQLVSNALYRTSPSTIVSRIGAIDVHGRDIARLQDAEWLNDEIANAGLDLLRRRIESSKSAYWKVWIANTFFFEFLSKKLQGYDFDRVKRWTKDVDMKSLDKIIVPIHLGAHWALAVVNFRLNRIEYYDSLCSPGVTRPIQQTLARWVKDIFREKYCESGPELAIQPTYTDVPRQDNSNDCGVFMLQFAAYLARRDADESRKLVFPFSQSTIPQLRRRLALEILRASSLS